MGLSHDNPIFLSIFSRKMPFFAFFIQNNSLPLHAEKLMTNND